MVSRSTHDMNGLLIAWCGALVLARHVQVDVPPRRRLAGVAIGLALLVLARLIDGERFVTASLRRIGHAWASAPPLQRRPDSPPEDPRA